MLSHSSRLRVLSLALIAAVAGCGGGNGTQVLTPNAPLTSTVVQHKTGERMLGTLRLDPRNSQTAMQYVAHDGTAHYYYGPSPHRAHAAT
ncbi:MAG TPA: hypothetical protein VK760_12055, partial [Candidatus Acidoferrales bacterium]|nr:hypothetical protein [Candidatus Acidoferrales bacterium]